MERVDYDDRLHAVYAAGRAMAPDTLERMLDGFGRMLPGRRPLTLVDVGSGVGRFTPHLADRFGGPVYGVEPSVRMREIAVRDAPHPAVAYLEGSAEAVPLADATCDAALLYFVWHHVVDQPTAARELRRVVRPGGTLVMRTQLADQMPDTWLYEVAPRMRAIDTAVYQSLAELRAIFDAAGWAFAGTETVSYRIAPTRRAFVDRLRLRALSTFEHMTEDEIDAVFDALGAAVERDPSPPVDEQGTLLAWRA